MTSPVSQTLIATASNGATVKYRGRAEYQFAAVRVTGPDTAELVARGFVKENVRKRARTILGSHRAEIVPFVVSKTAGAPAAVPEDIAAHFERKRLVAGTSKRELPMIVEIYAPGPQGWTAIEPLPATFATIRELASRGVLSAGVTAYGSPVADFPFEPMLRKAGCLPRGF